MFFGVVNGVLQGMVFGLASILPPNIMGIVMLGQGISGIFTNVLKVILLLVT